MERAFLSNGRTVWASIYEAVDQRTEATVALKVLHPEHNADAELTQRFTQEARLAAQIRHPNLVAAHDCGWLGGKRFIVLELVQGSSLSALLGNEPLPWQRSVPLVSLAVAGRRDGRRSDGVRGLAAGGEQRPAGEHGEQQGRRGRGDLAGPGLA